MTKKTWWATFRPLLGVLAVILGLVLVGPINPASATQGNGNDCVPSDAVAASFSDWSASGSYTAWQTSSTAADPDGQTGDDNPLNLQRLGASEQRTVTDKAASDETVIDSPAVEGQHYSLKGNSGLGKDDVPPTPLQNPGIWQANTHQEPPGHYGSAQEPDGSPYVDGQSGLHYTSAGSSGNRDWFYYQAPVAEQSHVVHHDAVTHTEYRWAIEKRTYTPAKDAVTCDDDPHNPGGNNGTIKVDDDGLPGCSVGGSDNTKCDNGVGNDPHLGCTFYVEWYNYEANATSTVSFEVQSPTGGTVTAVQGRVAPDTVTLDGDGPESGSNQGFDGAELYQLQFTDAPQPQQGWHVKVTTHTTSSNGADTKFKTFWVKGDCGVAPEPTTRTVHHSEESCEIGGVHTWDVVFTTTYTWDEESGEYVGHEDNGVITNDQTTPYTHDEAVEHGCTQVPEPTTRTVQHSEDGCEVGGVHTWDVVYTTTYTWDDETQQYVGTEDDGVIENDSFTPYTHDEQVELGCTQVPEPLQRTEHFSEDGCKVGGVHAWDVVYTTTFAWDEEQQAYVGTEDDGVIENETYTPYTAAELEDLGCVEVEGEQTHGHHGGNNHHQPEVKGEQATVPTVVPTQVEAGLAGTPAGTPNGGGSSLPLWALSLGAGLFLVGAGRLRRTSK